MNRFAMAAAVLLCAAGARAAFDLVLLEDAARNDGAVCLDGSPAGYYLRKSPSGSRSWVVYFEGGILCYRDIDCAARSKEGGGSSASWASTASFGGVLSEDAGANPEFADWNLVGVKYCDGSCFSGELAEPFVVNGVKVYSRGARVLKAVFNSLLKDQGMSEADNILVAGGSAGGMTVTFHANQIAEWIPSSVKRVKFGAFSAMMPPFKNVNGEPVVETEFKANYKLMNSTGGVSPACEKAMGSGNGYKCLFPTNSLEYVTVPYFVSSSMYDSWGTGCIWLAGYVEDGNTMNENCTGDQSWSNCQDRWQCSQGEIDAMNAQWKDPLMAIVDKSKVLKKAGNGVFLYSCHTHVSEEGQYNSIKVNGKSIREALVEWYFSDNDAASAHTSVDCVYTNNMMCNPTC